MERECGFSRIDLLATIVVTGMLILIGRPVGAGNKSTSDLAVCLNNVRQLSQAWTAFAVDRDDRFAGTVHGAYAMDIAPIDGPGANPQLAAWQPWGLGWLDWSTASANTNYALFSDPKYSSIANYVRRRKEFFKCPADVFLSRQQQALGFRERVRSYSSNIAVGDGNGGPGDGPWNDAYLKARKFSQLVNPGPSMSYVFLEEHPDSMNECAFFSPYGSPPALSAVDIPANYHDGAAVFSFADGRVEAHSWSGGARLNRVRYGYNPPSDFSMRPDLRYLYDRTPKRF